jgi:hypothetical protein
MYGWTKLDGFGDVCASIATIPSKRLTGISTRGTISKDKAMTGGILIQGTKRKKVVFMAKGYGIFVSDNVKTTLMD